MVFTPSLYEHKEKPRDERSMSKYFNITFTHTKRLHLYFP